MSEGFNDLLKLSECDYLACKAMEEHFPDEFAVRAALYHLQRAVEKVLKAVIIINGEYPAFTHDIDKLAEHCKKLGETFSDNLDDISDSLTLWESKSRYDPYISFSKPKYDKAKSVYEEIADKLKEKLKKQDQDQDQEQENDKDPEE